MKLKLMTVLIKLKKIIQLAKISNKIKKLNPKKHSNFQKDPGPIHFNGLKILNQLHKIFKIKKLIQPLRNFNKNKFKTMVHYRILIM